MKSFIKKILLIIGLSVSCLMAFGQTNVVTTNAFVKYLNAYKNNDTLRINKTYSLSPVKIYNRLSLKNYSLPLNKGNAGQVLKLGIGDSLIWINGTSLGYWSLTGDNLHPTTTTNYINNDSSYYLKGIDFIRYFPAPYFSTAIGDNALSNDTVGQYNTAIGTNSLSKNSTGQYNTALGLSSLYLNTTGRFNVSVGAISLEKNTTGEFNTAIGTYSLSKNTTGQYNSAFGSNSLRINTTGKYNTSIGQSSLYFNITDSNNIALGYKAGYDAVESNKLWIGAGNFNNAIIYGNMLDDSLRLNATVSIRDVALSTSDSLLTKDNGVIHYKILDLSPYTQYSDTTSTLLTQSKASNTYQLKYWSKTGTAITPYTSTDTIISTYQRISGIYPTATTLLEVTSTGLIDTIASTPINPIYVKKAGDTLNGDFHLTGGTFSLDTYAATSQKSLITQPSGLIDTVPMITIDDAVISSIKLTDSITIGGIVTISDTTLVADEDSIYFKRGKSGWGSIYADSSGTFVAWVNFYWNSNGTPYLQNNSARVVASDTDANVICLYAYSGGLAIRNRSGSTMKFKITLNY